MYEKHFGLKKRLFHTLAQGTDVFVGPQSAEVMKAIKKALKAEDAVVTVTGAAGVGKSSIGRRALDGVGDARILVAIGRMPLGNDEVVELLLAGLGARQMPKSMVHRFAAFRRLLQQYAEQNKRVIVVVEDATRIGADALSEIEALTAEDAGVSAGANILLMGDSRLAELLREPKLARLKQRVRLRQEIQPLGEPELQAYLKHCFRLAGAEFDGIFEPGTVTDLHSLSDGIPRMVNNLVEAALTSAAEDGKQNVSTALLNRIANEEFGLTGQHKVAAIEQISAAADAADDVADLPTATTLPDATIEAPAIPEDAPAADNLSKIDNLLGLDDVPELEKAAAAAEVPGGAEPKLPAGKIDDKIPELIQDTLPDLEILAPALANAAGSTEEEEADPSDTITELTALPDLPDDGAEYAEEEDLPTLYDSGRIQAPAEATPAVPPEPAASAPELQPEPAPEPVPEPVPEPEPEPELEPLPEPEPEPLRQAEAPPPEPAVVAEEPAHPDVREVYAEEPVLQSPDAEVPEWDRDPTLAELKPDLDALERAMAIAQGGEAEAAAAAPPEAEAPPAEVEAPPAAIDPSEPKVVPEITLDREIQAKIDEATEALSHTNVDAFDEAGDVDSADSQAGADAAPKKQGQSLRDTTELKQIASGLAKAKTIEDIDDKLAETLFGEELNLIAAEVIANAPPGYSANDDNDSSEPEPAPAQPTPDLEAADALSLEAEPEACDPHGNVDGSPSQRLATLRSLNATSAPPGAPRTPEATESIVMAEDIPRSAVPEDQPDSIETQMDTSMTATLQALSIRPEDIPDDDEEEKKKGGFFSRFRRS